MSDESESAPPVDVVLFAHPLGGVWHTPVEEFQEPEAQEVFIWAEATVNPLLSVIQY